jgi:hypothetical protein
MTNSSEESSGVEEVAVRREQQAKTNEDERLKELQDQKAYLEEKLEFLTLQKKRNEQEITRLNSSNTELRELRSSIKRQLIKFVNVVNDWQRFRDGIVKESNVWEQKAEKIVDA